MVMKKRNVNVNLENSNGNFKAAQSCLISKPTSSERGSGEGGSDKKRCVSCVIGLLNTDGQSRLVTVEALIKHIEHKRAIHDMYVNGKSSLVSGGNVYVPKVYTLEDYCSGEQRTDMFRFTCCPICGQSINYRRIIDKYI